MKLCRYLALLFLAASLLFPASVYAGKARKSAAPAAEFGAYQNKPIVLGATVWYCAYGGQTEILCRLGERGNDLIRPIQRVSSKLPRIVGDILNHPERLARGHVSIPLHTDPFDFELVGQLAEAVMCGSNASCGVVFAESLRELPALVASFETTRRASAAMRLAVVYSLAEADS